MIFHWDELVFITSEVELTGTMSPIGLGASILLESALMILINTVLWLCAQWNINDRFISTRQIIEPDIESTALLKSTWLAQSVPISCDDIVLVSAVTTDEL